MTDPVCVEHSFGTGNDMFSKNTQTRNHEAHMNPDKETHSVVVTLFADGPMELVDVIDCYIHQGFLKTVYADGSYDCWNVSDVSHYSVEPE